MTERNDPPHKVLQEVFQKKVCVFIFRRARLHWMNELWPSLVMRYWPKSEDISQEQSGQAVGYAIDVELNTHEILKQHSTAVDFHNISPHFSLSHCFNYNTPNKPDAM